MHKICRFCQISKPLNEYYSSQTNKDRLQNHCKACDNLRTKADYQSHKEHYKKLGKEWRMTHREQSKILDRKSNLKCRYRMTLQDYDTTYNNQKGQCLICGHNGKSYTESGRKDSLEIDHSWHTGIVRGLICRKCNMILAFCDDNIKILSSAINYLTT